MVLKPLRKWLNGRRKRNRYFLSVWMGSAFYEAESKHVVTSPISLQKKNKQLFTYRCLMSIQNFCEYIDMTECFDIPLPVARFLYISQVFVGCDDAYFDLIYKICIYDMLLLRVCRSCRKLHWLLLSEKEKITRFRSLAAFFTFEYTLGRRLTTTTKNNKLIINQDVLWVVIVRYMKKKRNKVFKQSSAGSSSWKHLLPQPKNMTLICTVQYR
jgi:hypothetical protein